MSKYGTDENGWPLVPCDPAATPDGYEAVKVTWPTKEETFSCGYRERVVAYSVNRNDDTFSVCLVIRPIPKTILLPLAIVPEGWWVAKDEDNQAWVYEAKPSIGAFAWIQEGVAGYKLPPWIAAQLPAAWHALPWDQSAVQQKEGGDT